MKQTLVTWLPWPSYLWLGAWWEQEKKRRKSVDEYADDEMIVKVVAACALEEKPHPFICLGGKEQ